MSAGTNGLEPYGLMKAAAVPSSIVSRSTDTRPTAAKRAPTRRHALRLVPAVAALAGSRDRR